MGKMRFTILLISFGFLVVATLRGQEQQQLGFATNHFCQEMALELTELIPRIYPQGNIDSILVYMYEWDLQCGLAEPLLRMYILHFIATNTFDEDFLPDNIFDYLFDYQYVASSEKPDRFLDYYSWEFDRIHPSFNPFTVELAEYLGGYEDLSDTERFLVLYYSHNFDAAWESLNSKKLEATRLGKLYHKLMIDRFDNAYKPSVWLMAGAWIPNGNLALLGSHPQLGLGVGFYRKGLFADLCLAIAFLNSKNEYEVTYLYQRHTVKNFTNLSLSMSVGGVFSINRQPFMKLGISVGYEGIMAISPRPEFQEPGKFINSISLGPVLEFSLPLSENYYLGFFSRYNFLWFNNHSGTNLKGNAQWLGIKLGRKLFAQNRVGEYLF